MDIKISVLDPTDPAPAAVAADQTVGDFRNMNAVRCEKPVSPGVVSMHYLSAIFSEQRKIEALPSPQIARHALI